MHVYATEHWSDYVLAEAACDRLAGPSRLIAIACQLSDKLNEIVGPTHRDMSHSTGGGTLDGRFITLERYPSLCKLVQRALEARSLAKLEAELLKRGGKT